MKSVILNTCIPNTFWPVATAGKCRDNRKYKRGEVIQVSGWSLADYQTQQCFVSFARRKQLKVRYV